MMLYMPEVEYDISKILASNPKHWGVGIETVSDGTGQGQIGAAFKTGQETSDRLAGRRTHTW